MISSSVSVQSRSGRVHLSANVAPVMIVMCPLARGIIARGYLNINPVSQSTTIQLLPLAVARWPPRRYPLQFLMPQEKDLHIDSAQGMV